MISKTSTLLITCDFDIGRARAVALPETCEVILHDQNGKDGVGMSFLSQQTASIVVLLHQAGIVDWVLSKSYDALWEYLGKFFREVAGSYIPTVTKIEVKDQDGNVRAMIEGLSPGEFGQAEINLKESVKRMADGSQSSVSVIKIKFTKRS